MTQSSQIDPFANIDRLAGAVSAQAKATTRTWLATLTVALVALLPRAPTAPGDPDVVKLPFSLGDVDTTAFYPIVFAILVVFAVALASGQAQHMRIQRLAHEVIDDLSRKYSPSVASVHPRDLFDVLVASGLTRVAPLAQCLRGKCQFAASPTETPPIWRAASTGYYLLLKFLVFAVLFLLPVVALWSAHGRVSEAVSGWVLFLFSGAGLVAACSLVVVLFEEIRYVVRVSCLLFKPRPVNGELGGPPNKAMQADAASPRR